MSVFLTLKVEGTSPTATQLSILQAYAQQLFGNDVKLGIAVPTPQGQEESKDEPVRNPQGPQWDEELQAWIDPFGNWLVNFG